MDEDGNKQPPSFATNNILNPVSGNTDSQQHQPQLNTTNDDGFLLDERLAILQELYQRHHAELLAQFQQTQTLAQQDYLLNLQRLQSALPAAAAMVVLQQQQITTPPNVSIQDHPFLGSLRQASSEQSTEESDPIMTTAVSVAAHQIQPQKQISNSAPLTTAASTTNTNVAATTRNRRTFSGSGQTISQHTRDRLKSMIATKKQKQQLHSSSSTGSTSNIALATATLNTTTSNWSQGSNVLTASTNSELNLMSGTKIQSESIDSSSIIPTSLVNNSHIDQRFLPYPHPAHYPGARNTDGTTTLGVSEATSATTNLSITDFQLRKVNSEPNLKMRIRARLLNKGSSPHQQTQQQANVAVVTVASSTVHQQTPVIQQSQSNILQRQNSGDAVNGIPAMEQKQQQNPATAIDVALLFQKSAQQAFNGNQQLLNIASTSAANMMVPSPSLPNLPATLGPCGGIVNVGGDGLTGSGGSASTLANQDMLNLVSLQNTFMHFLSMPSLLKNQLLPTNSMFDTLQPLADSSASSSSSSGLSAPMQRTVRFDNRSAPMPLGYPSLLKQQLRDLVLRRKSLVREEPEDDTIMDFSTGHVQSSKISGGIEQMAIDSQKKTGLAYDQSMVKHQCLCSDNNNHVEHGGRIQSIWSKLIETGLVSQCERVLARKAPLEVLRLVHSPTYVTFFAVSPTACLKLDPAELPLKSFVQLPCGGIGVDSDTYFNDASTQTAAKMAVGALVELCCHVMEGKLRNGFACIRPPGHHAEREQAMGFCFFNNVAIAARFLQQRFGAIGCPRIAIIDWDVHHGNGTQLCFESDPNCLYLSLHRHDNGNFFPGTGAVTEIGVGEGKGTTVNIPFSGDVMGDAEYLAAWRVLVIPILDAYKPNFILVSAGFDAAQGHPAALGGYNLSPKLFGYLTRTLMQFANGRVVLTLEGGYELSTISESAEQCVKALCANSGDITQFISAETLEQVPNLSAQETIQKVIAVHKKHWPCLTGVQGINTSELHWQRIQNVGSQFAELQF